MKKYVNPEFEMLFAFVNDVITSSNGQVTPDEEGNGGDDYVNEDGWEI